MRWPRGNNCLEKKRAALVEKTSCQNNWWGNRGHLPAIWGDVQRRAKKKGRGQSELGAMVFDYLKKNVGMKRKRKPVFRADQGGGERVHRFELREGKRAPGGKGEVRLFLRPAGFAR